MTSSIWASVRPHACRLFRSQYKSTQCIKKRRSEEILNQLKANSLCRKADKDADVALDGCFIPNRIFVMKWTSKVQTSDLEGIRSCYAVLRKITHNVTSYMWFGSTTYDAFADCTWSCLATANGPELQSNRSD